MGIKEGMYFIEGSNSNRGQKYFSGGQKYSSGGQKYFIKGSNFIGGQKYFIVDSFSLVFRIGGLSQNFHSSKKLISGY